MAITIDKVDKPESLTDIQNVWLSVPVEGETVEYIYYAPKDLEGSDLQDWVDSKEEYITRDILRSKYLNADCYEGTFEEWETWIANGKVNEAPDMSWSKADIQAYMDTHSIASSAGDSKAELLTKITEYNDNLDNPE